MLDRTKKNFPGAYSYDLLVSGGLEGAAKGYEHTRGLTHKCYLPLFPKLSLDDTITITQEFGTFPMTVVGLGMMFENMAYHYQEDSETRKPFADALRWIFTPTQQSFYEMAMARGTTVISQAIEMFSLPVSSQK
mmetsp:Transcript_36196/g.71254  ORF Transcript_36196/g.71254 Transcript_36196/m.71254 type:complete len:134 (-) Transcript_36196:196-597(-)